MDLGQAKHVTHKIYLKDNNRVYQKQFKIPEAHQNFIEAKLDEWLKLGVVKSCNFLYNSPLFCVPKNKVKVSELCKISVISTTTHTSKNRE
jgi:hypothetical protein